MRLRGREIKAVGDKLPSGLSLALERSYEAHGRCGNGLKRMRARGSLAKTVSGYSYSRHSKSSITEGSMKRSIFREGDAACCMQRKRELSGGPEGHYI